MGWFLFLALAFTCVVKTLYRTAHVHNDGYLLDEPTVHIAMIVLLPVHSYRSGYLSRGVSWSRT